MTDLDLVGGRGAASEGRFRRARGSGPARQDGSEEIDAETLLERREAEGDPGGSARAEADRFVEGEPDADEPGTDRDAEQRWFGDLVDDTRTPEDERHDDWQSELEVGLEGPSPRGFGYKIGLAAIVGVSIWLVVNLLSPTNLVDTQDAQPDGGVSAGDGEPDVEPAGTGGREGSAVGTGDQKIEVGGEGSTEAGPTEAGPTEAGPTEGPDATAGDGTDAEGEPGPGTDETAAPLAAAATTSGSLDYRSNLEMLLGATVRNRNHDDSPYLDTPSAQLVPTNHYGPRSEYLGNPGGNPEQAFPVGNGGQFRAGCEFSHFSYDDPLVFPGKPGASHLHMHFGNTHVNAFSTYDTLVNSGSSTCNGQELNRTGYWVPAMFDGNGNVRIPERVVVYYKGEGRSLGNTIAYPPEAAMVMNDNLNTLGEAQGGVAGGKLSFVCSDNFSSPSGIGGQTVPACDGSRFKNQYGVDDNPRVVLEMNVKFPQCWNGQDPADWSNFRPPPGNWYGSNCGGEFNRHLPNLEYFINYPVEIGENTSDWFLSSDIDPTSFGAAKATGGSTLHGDWWGGWHAETNQQWVDNCVNFSSGSPSGCGFGYLTDGGSNGGAPVDGPALKMRPQYTGPTKVSAEQLLGQLCPDPEKVYSKPEDAAYCRPGDGL